MIGFLDLALRLAIWFLLTADLSPINVFIGICVAVLVPGPRPHGAVLKDWLITIWEVLVAIPQAYFEAIEIMLFPHTEEEVVLERVKPNRSPGLIFLDIFIITFTPKTIVLKYRDDGWFEVHRICRRKAS